jgi:hypothetical protein
VSTQNRASCKFETGRKAEKTDLVAKGSTSVDEIKMVHLLARKNSPPSISTKDLAHAINAAAAMGFKEKEQVCDAIFLAQPNLLGSILALPLLDVSMETVDVLLDILIVTHLAVEESGQVLEIVSEEQQARQMDRYVASVNFAAGLGSELSAQSLYQTTAYKKEKFLLAYVLKTMTSAAFADDQDESAKYPMLAGINLVNCIASAKRIR